MKNDHQPQTGILSRIPKPTVRQRRIIAMGTAAAIVVSSFAWALGHAGNTKKRRHTNALRRRVRAMVHWKA